MALDQHSPHIPAHGPDDPPHPGDDLRAYVTISREHPDDARQRQVLVRIDEGPTHTLLFGQRVTEEIRPGTHALRANNTLFWKRLAFSVEPGERLEFVAINRPGRLMLGFLSLLGVAPLYLSIERRSAV